MAVGGGQCSSAAVRQGGRVAEGTGSADLGRLSLERCLAASLKGLGEALAEPLAMLARVTEHLGEGYG